MDQNSPSAIPATDGGSRSQRFIAEFLERKSSKKLTGLLFARLDAYNRIGATFGDARSAEFCNEYVGQLRAMLPENTPIIRMSERRFAILLSLDSMTTIIDVASRLSDENPPQFHNGDDTLFVDLTLGIAVYPTHADCAESLFRRAELALNEAAAKSLSFEIYRPDATQQQAALWKFASDLERAIKNAEIELYMQPKIRVSDGKHVGAEVLIRWRQEGGRLVLPNEFVPLAEHSGSIVPLTWLVFKKLKAVVDAWPDQEEECKIAVNIAPRLFDHADFPSRLGDLREHLASKGVGLIVELTEEGLMSDYQSAIARLHNLRRSGVELSIDDFGSGYSSLNYLKDIPASEIKIDKSFVASAAVDIKNWHIIKAATDLAHAFGMRVCAEGVESMEVLKAVKELGCELAQGFVIARPIRAELLMEWARAYDGNSAACNPILQNQPRIAEA